ncbi:MAG: hypothetical protein ACK5QT_02390 [Oligoflexia bacterium]
MLGWNLLGWVTTWILALWGLSLWVPEIKQFLPQKDARLEPAKLLLKDLRECLVSGELPSEDQWSQVSAIPDPWGGLIQESLEELRESGLPVVPTLERLQVLLGEQISAGAQARARTAQAWGQALVCGSFVPLVAAVLYVLLPGVSEWGALWWMITGAACLMSLGAMLWILRLCESARWAGLSATERLWWPSILCFGERMLASLRAGSPPDLAWSGALPQLSVQASRLVLCWGADFWSPRPLGELSTGMKGVLEQWGQQLREALQRSVVEGRPCAERLESSLVSLKQDWMARVERELGLLGTRALQPLFLLVAPAVLGVLGLGVFLGVTSGATS